MEKFGYIFFIFIFNYIKAFATPLCKPGFNYCLACNSLTNLCSKCENENFLPDENGGCKKKCIVGNNNCIECNIKGDLCIVCDEGYFLDENNGCSYTDNCKISENGECIECNDNFILIGLEDSIKICKSLFSEDLKNCNKINNETGLCEECKDNFYLNSGDKRCSNIPKCSQSVFGKCIKCNYGYYLDKKEEECKIQNDIFIHCKESINGEICDICDDNFYFNENGKCIAINFCLKESVYYNKCEKCISGYFLSQDNSSCTTDINCFSGNKDTGICQICKEGNYVDYKDGKCKSNQEDNDFKYCKVADEICIECLEYYYLGDDYKCSNVPNCSESINGICIGCIDNFYLGLDNRCTIIEHCIYSYYFDYCYECEDGYYYNKNDIECQNDEGIFSNCKYGNGTTFCERCKDDFYLNQTDKLCYSNKNKDNFYRCAVTDPSAQYCYICSKTYNIGDIDHKCTNVEGCDLSENEDKCLQCGLYYCLDAKTGKCEYNDIIISEEKKFYYRCNKTNKEGTECAECIDNYILKDGLCVDEEHCVEKNEDGKCIKCLNDEENSFCLNNNFGCVDLFFDYCLECNDAIDLEKCTKCFDGYKIDEYDQCDEIEEEI